MRQGTNNEETERRFSTIGFSKSKWPIETKPRISKQRLTGNENQGSGNQTMDIRI